MYLMRCGPLWWPVHSIAFVSCSIRMLILQLSFEIEYDITLTWRPALFKCLSHTLGKTQKSIFCEKHPLDILGGAFCPAMFL